MATAALTRMSPEEYLAQERHAEFRSEYIDGRVVAMAGSSLRHVRIVGNLFAAIHGALPDRCTVANNDLRVKISASRRYVYPDVVAFCGQGRFEDGVLDALVNPVLVAEVLSETTEAYDRGEKFLHYRAIESLSEYVLVSQKEMRVERFVRHGDVWHLTDLRGADEVLVLASLACEVPLSSIYRGVEFGPADPSG